MPKKRFDTLQAFIHALPPTDTTIIFLQETKGRFPIKPLQAPAWAHGLFVVRRNCVARPHHHGVASIVIRNKNGPESADESKGVTVDESVDESKGVTVDESKGVTVDESADESADESRDETKGVTADETEDESADESKGVEDVTDEVLAAHDNVFSRLAREEGRVIVLRIDSVTFFNVYVPNSGVGKKPLSRLAERIEWDAGFASCIRGVAGPVVVAGDMNVVADKALDVWNPKLRRCAGNTREERDGFAALRLEDVCRESREFTFFSARCGRRPGLVRDNKGWRLDYVLRSLAAPPFVASRVLHEWSGGSDHSPLVVSTTNFC